MVPKGSDRRDVTLTLSQLTQPGADPEGGQGAHAHPFLSQIL